MATRGSHSSIQIQDSCRLKMTADIYNYKGYQIKKVVNIALFALNAILFSAMVTGPVGGISLYMDHNFPIWAYVLTVLFMILSAAMYLFNLQNKAPILGKIDFSNDQLTITQKGTKQTILKSEIDQISISSDYSRTKIYLDKSQCILQLNSKKLDQTFDLLLDKKDDKSANDIIDQLNS